MVATCYELNSSYHSHASSPNTCVLEYLDVPFDSFTISHASSFAVYFDVCYSSLFENYDLDFEEEEVLLL